MLALLQTRGSEWMTCRLPLWSVSLSSSVVALCRSASALCVGQAPRCSLPMGLEERSAAHHLSACGHTEMESTARASKSIEWLKGNVPLASLVGASVPAASLPQCHAATQSRRRGPGADATSVSVGGSGRMHPQPLYYISMRDKTMRVSLRKALQQPQWQPQWQRRLSPLCLSTATRSLCRLHTHSHAPWR